MDVERTRADILDYLSGGMSEDRRAEFEARMQADPRLARFVRQHLRVDRMLEELPGADPSAQRLSRMTEAILGSERPRPAAPIVAFPRRWVAAAAAVLVAAVWLGWSVLGPEDGPGSDVAESADDPAFLSDPEFVQDFEVIRDLKVLDGFGEELDLPADDALLDVVTLQVLTGAGS